jgi:hypothetical protein
MKCTLDLNAVLVDVSTGLGRFYHRVRYFLVSSIEFSLQASVCGKMITTKDILNYQKKVLASKTNFSLPFINFFAMVIISIHSLLDVLGTLKIFLKSQNLVVSNLPIDENLVLKTKPSTLFDALKVFRLKRFAVIFQVTQLLSIHVFFFIIIILTCE